MTRPLVDNEKITITAIDNAGNKTTETINVGDVTKPEVEVNIVDNNTVHIVSNEPGSKVIIKNEAGQTIGEGVIGSNGELNVDLNTTLTDGSQIIVDVIDTSGNQTEKVITVGDVTPPIIESNIKDATHIEVTSNESGQVKITDSNGNVIGTGTITGNNVVDDIQLTRPLADGEKVTVTVTDAAGNPKALDIIAGDVTAPIITSTVQDATHIEVSSNEAGQVKITDSNGNVIGTGTITGNNVVDDIQLTRPLADGETVTVTVTDAAGNPKALDITAGDVTAPTITSTVQDATHIEVTSNEAGQVKITDSNGNVIGTGTITGNNVVDDIQLTRPLADGETVTVTVTDAAGNPKALDITVGDVTAPTITSTVQDATHIEVSSNEAGQVKITDSNGNVIGTGTITGNNVVDDIQLTRPLADGEKVTVTVTDAAGNPKAIDITAGDVTNPQFESANVDNSGTQLTLTYSEALDSTNLPTPDSFVVTAGGQSVTVTGVSINGNNVILTLAPPITTGQSVQIAYTDPTTGNDTNAIQDVAGNDAASLPTTTVTNDSTVPGTDTTPPIFVSATVDNTGTQLVLTYNKDLDSANLPLINSFAVTADGQIVAVTGVSVNGSTVVLTLGTPVTAGQAVQVGYTDPTAGNDPNAIQDIAGNDAATLPPTSVSNGSVIPGGDTTAPTFVNATVDPLGTTLTLNYNEALDPLNPPVAGDFAVTADGQVVAITNVLVVGSSVVLTLGAPVTAGQAVQVGYTDPTAGNDPNAIQDIAGNDAATLPPTSVSNGSLIPGGDTTAPTFVNATVDPLGTTLTLNYNEALDPLNPPVAGDFAVTADGQVVAITNVLVVGSSVVLTLGAPVTAGQAVQVGYTDPTAGNDPNAIQDIAGNDAATLPPTSVSNGSLIPGGDTTAPTFVNATVDPLGTTLTLNYNEALDPLNPPVAGDFAVTADGQVVAITNVLVVGSSVVLTLGAPVTAGQAVQVGYTDPTAGNDPNAIQDIAGNDAATLPPTSVSNGSIVLPPLNAVNDEFALNLGQEVRVNRTEVAGSDIAVVDILGNNATGLNFSIPQTPGSAGKGATGNISVTVSQQDLISVGEAVQIVIYQQTSNGPVEVARGTSQGGIVTVGGIGIIGVVNSNDSIKLDFTNLPEGNYTVAVQADDSALTTLLKDVAITDLGGEGEILGASNAAAIEAAINAVLGPLGAPVLALVNTILIPVNTLGLPLSSVVNQLLNVLPISVVDYIVDAAVAPLLSNLLTIYEKTNISVTGTEEVFANYAVTGNVFADNGNGQDVIGGGSITEIDGAPVAQGSVTIQGEYGSLEINTLTGVFTYTVTAGESAVGKTEIFDYKLSNGATSDTAQIIINIAGTPADPGELTPPDYVDQVVANDDLATVKNYQETAGDDVGVEGRASQLLGVNLLGLNISLGNTVPFNFEVEENSTSSINVNVSGSVVSAAIGGIVGTLLGTADKYFNAVLERQYLDENGVAQKEYFIVEDAVKLTPPGLLGIVFNYSGQINVDNLPPGVYTIALQEKPSDAGLLQQLLNLLDSTLSAQLFGGVELTMQAQTNKYLGSGSIEGNVISSADGADEVNTTTFVTKVANEVGDPAVTLSGANTVVVGAYGTLYISPNGHYKYVSNGDPADIGKVDTFTYTIRDFNGSEATANLNIRIDGDNSGVVWDNTNPQNDVTLPAPVVLDNSDHAVIGTVTNTVQTVNAANQGSFAVAGTLGGGGGTYVPTTFNVANTDSSHVVVKVNIPALSVSILPTVVLTVKDQNGTVVGTVTGKPILNALGSSITVDIPNLGPGTYTIEASASANIGLGFTASVSLAQDITHYNEIGPVTAAPITGNMLTDDTYNHAYAKFSIDTGNGQFTEVGYNGITIQGDYGSLFVKSDGSYVYTPKAGEIGRQEVFDYKLTVFGQDHIASLTVTIDAITTGDALRNTLISGELNDSFTGNGGSDVLVYHVLESASATGGNGTDHWTDFHAGNVNTDTNADVIDISDLLIGFNSANITTDLTASANYLKNYLGVRVDGNNVTLTLDRDGAGTTYTGKTDLLQLDNLAQSGAAFNGKTEDDILKLLLQNHQLVL
ncbi:type I secretion C-terminal target domain-containing protein [Acinetobacter bereziniae]|uniref:BapA/Bap/LapF family large adhesin n=8 Tax=Acinetobacter bereziniae TaxID=106648 RepID=UPI00158002DD|nr:BapA/Bap/LapF family large adhesin [Acinetobacter bereziniae]NUF64516.1 type I secretion C-terminal target domain-containing protein [Acinetobacter bereziniae]